MGYAVEERTKGYFRRTPSHGEVVLKPIEPSQVNELIEEARSEFDGSEVRFWVESRELDARLEVALRSAGCTAHEATSYLAHVGQPAESPRVAGLTTVAVTNQTVRLYVVTRQKAFSDSEEEPEVPNVISEVQLRSREMRGQGRFRIAEIEGEAAAVLGWYEGNDQFIFQLGTRVPFRRQGIARQLLSDLLEESYERGCRSVLINAEEGGAPIQLYRRLGFRDEVYWRRGYEYTTP